MPTVSTADIIRNINNRLACLALREVSRDLTDGEKQERAGLQAKLDRLNRESIEAKYSTEQRNS